jgi:hypothetical protein
MFFIVSLTDGCVASPRHQFAKRISRNKSNEQRSNRWQRDQIYPFDHDAIPNIADHQGVILKHPDMPC